MLDTNQSPKPLNVLYYCSSWPINIGNAFIDLGAIAVLQAAIPDARIIFASEMPRWVFDVADREQPSASRWSKLKARPTFRDNALDIAAVTECDLFVYAGMSMCEEFHRVNGPAALALSRRGVPVLLLGTGADWYNDEEKKAHGAFLRELKPLSFISRDDRSFDMFAEFVPDSHRGIDCGFFVADAYPASRLLLPPYIVSAFDTTEAAALNPGGRQVYHAHHETWGPSPPEYLRLPNTLISDIPHDYLNLYAGAEEVHSDRVHACVAALSYGRPARLYHKTPRGSLFEAAGAATIRERLTVVDQVKLKEKKARQVELVRNAVAGRLGVRPVGGASR